MRIIFLIIVVSFCCGCSLNKPTLMKTGSVHHAKNNGNPVFSMGIPDGSWYLIAPKTLERGVINLQGVPPSSFVGYAIRFSAESLEGKHNLLKEVKAVLKSHDYNTYLKQAMDSFTLEQQEEMNAKKYSGKVIFFQGYGCKNYWFEWLIAPQANEGRGVTVFRSFITCPLVIDGKIYRFNINIDSSVRPEFYTQKAKYDRNKRPEDPEIYIDTDELLKTLGDRVLVLFKDIKFHGRVSQNYDDVLVKCDPATDDQC